MPMTDEELKQHLRDADEALRAMSEEERRAILASVRGSLAAEPDGELTPEDEEVLLAKARGDLTDQAFIETLLPPRGR